MPRSGAPRYAPDVPSTENTVPSGPTTGGGRPAVARLAERLGVHYAWVVVGVVFLVVLVASGARSAAGVFIKPLEEEFGWSRSAVSAPLAVSLLAMAASGPISGWAFTRFGLRRAVVGFLALGGLGAAATAVMSTLWQFHLAWGLLVGLGTGGVGLVIGGVVATTWFSTHRGLVAGILGGAASAGQLLLIKAAAWVTDTSGWRTAMWGVVLLLAAVVPLAWILLRARPADAGATPFGGGVGAAPVGADIPPVPLRTALRTGDLWLLSASFFVCGFTTIGLIGYHFIPHATEAHGYSTGEAANLLSLIGAMNVVGTVASGWLCDRYPPRLLLAGYYGARGLSLLALPFMSSVPFLSGFAIVFGLDYIATVPATIAVITQRYGPRSVPSLYGFVIFLHMVGAAVAAQLAGWIHDYAEQYAPAFYLGGLLAVAAGAMSFALSQRRATAVAA